MGVLDSIKLWKRDDFYVNFSFTYLIGRKEIICFILMKEDMSKIPLKLSALPDRSSDF